MKRRTPPQGCASTTRRTSRRQFCVKRPVSALTLLGVTLAMAACGTTGKPSGAPRNPSASHPASTCILLQNGNEVCGGAAVSYCQRFETSPPDAQTAQACAAVDPSRYYQAPLPPASESHGKVPCGEYPTPQQQNQCMKSALAPYGIAP